jgi:glycosyltransferase involved in cell wall biosynthesis
MESPLVTLFVLAFKQEQFIREAVQSVFDQTYSPLEIILSDDCSPDKTYEIMEQMAAAYRGPHRLVMNRNPKNLGLCGHVNRIMEIARGELIMPAAGDDISYPGRVATTVGVWQSCGLPPFIFFDVEVFSSIPSRARPFVFQPETVSVESMLRLTNPTILAPAMAWRKTVFERFGPLPASAPTEDKNIAFRAALLGPVVFVSQKLVKYRIHGENMTYKNKSRHRSRQEMLASSILRLEGRLDAFEADLRKAIDSGSFTPAQQSNFENAIKVGRSRIALRKNFLNGNLLTRFRSSFEQLQSEQKQTKRTSRHLAKALHAAITRKLPSTIAV